MVSALAPRSPAGRAEARPTLPHGLASTARRRVEESRLPCWSEPRPPVSGLPGQSWLRPLGRARELIQVFLRAPADVAGHLPS